MKKKITLIQLSVLMVLFVFSGVANAQITLSPVKDTYVDANYPTTDNGASEEIRTKRGIREAYLQFDLSSTDLTNLVSATLKLGIRLSEPGVVSPVSVYSTTDITWSESLLYADALVTNNKYTTTVVGGDNTIYYEWDVTAYLQSITDEGAVTLVLKEEPGVAAVQKRFRSQNSPLARKPILELTGAAVLSIDEHELLDFSISPMPIKNKLNIHSDTQIIDVSIYNHLGQLLVQAKMTNTLDVSKLNAGVYFAKVEDAKGHIGVKKIIKN